MENENQTNLPGTTSGDEGTAKPLEYTVAKKEFADLYPIWVAMSDEQQEGETGAEIRGKLDAAHAIIMQYEPKHPDGPADGTVDAEPPAPGTGIDTDGDGNADEIIEADEPAADVHVDHEDDYIGKVKLSGNIGDTMVKGTATKLVNASQINQFFKDDIKKQISAGEITKPAYKEVLIKLQRASDGGTIYRPGADGL